MLVLSRKENETILIDGGIKVTVVAIKGNKIRLGVEAPREVGVWREELVAVPVEDGIDGGVIPQRRTVWSTGKKLWGPMCYPPLSSSNGNGNPGRPR